MVGYGGDLVGLVMMMVMCWVRMARTAWWMGVLDCSEEVESSGGRRGRDSDGWEDHDDAGLLSVGRRSTARKQVV